MAMVHQLKHRAKSPQKVRCQLLHGHIELHGQDLLLRPAERRLNQRLQEACLALLLKAAVYLYLIEMPQVLLQLESDFQ